MGETIDGRRGGRRCSEAVLGVVVDPEYLFAAGGDTKVGRQVGEGLWDVGRD